MMFPKMSLPRETHAELSDRDDWTRAGFGCGSDQERSGKSAAMSRVCAMGGRNFRGRFAEHRWIGRHRATSTARKVVQFHFNGTWPKKKNWALENLPFQNDWVLILDADEVLPPAAEKEIAEADCECRRDRRLLDQSALLFPRTLVAALLLSELESATF